MPTTGNGGSLCRVLDHAIALRALEAMKDDGRGVLLIGSINKLAKTPEARSDAYDVEKDVRAWLAQYRFTTPPAATP